MIINEKIMDIKTPWRIERRFNKEEGYETTVIVNCDGELITQEYQEEIVKRVNTYGKQTYKVSCSNENFETK